MKQNRNFAKPDENSRPIYAPTVLRVVTHHHDEGVDPETGEHWERDWDTYETKTKPTAADYAQMGWLPLVDSVMPTPPEGKHWERNGKIYSFEDGYAWDYELVDNPPPPPRRWSSLAIKRVLDPRGSWDQIKGLLEAAGVYDDFLMADYIAEDDEAFLAARAEAVKLYGEETVAAILDTIPTEGGAA